MTTLLATPTADVATWPGSAGHAGGPIIVAVDGTDGSTGAIRAADLLANRGGAHLGVVSAFQNEPPNTGFQGDAIPDRSGVRCDLLQRVLVQLANTSPLSGEWRIDMRCGESSEVIARAAEERSARLILMGLGRHRILDRVLGAEATVRTLKRTRTPVLAVPPTFDRLPKRAVLATDFGASSLRAARAALEFFPGLTEVFLVHVAPMDEIAPPVAPKREGASYFSVDDEIERFRSRLDPHGALAIETVVLLGAPVHEILAFSKRVAADLIVAGTHGARHWDRLLVGSTATRLLRGAECAVLTVPDPADASPRIASDADIVPG
jgi:nucleotide-binding universal stress UspA family protein